MQFIRNKRTLDYEIPCLSLGLILIFHSLVIFRRKWPFHTIFFVVLLIFGYIFDKWLSSFTKNTIFEANWPNNIVLSKILNTAVHKKFLGSLFKSVIVFEPYFIINIATLAILTIIESGIALKLTADMSGTKVNKRRELISVAVTNIIAGIFGLVPVSIPVCSNILVYKLGTTSKVYNLLAAVFLVLMVWVLPFVFSYIPMILVSVFNFSMGLMMFDPDIIYYYWKYNRKHSLALFAIMGLSFFVHIVFGILIAWVVFFSIYLNRLPNKSFSLISAKEFGSRFTVNEIGTDILKLMHVDAAIENSLSTSMKDILKQISQTGIVYELQGRFNFIYYSCHIQNITYLLQLKRSDGPVVIDFDKVWDFDREFIRDYKKFIEEVQMITPRLYVSGIPVEAVGEHALEQDTWIEQFDEENRILFNAASINPLTTAK